MFTGVRDLGHQRAQSGKKRWRVRLSWETYGCDLETPFKKQIASLAILALRGSATKPSIRRCEWPDSGEACLATPVFASFASLFKCSTLEFHWWISNVALLIILTAFSRRSLAWVESRPPAIRSSTCRARRSSPTISCFSQASRCVSRQ